MAGEERDKGGFGNLSSIIAVLMLVAGAIWVNLSLEGRRPASAAAGFRPTGAQDVDARLWQDPFTVVAKAREKRAASRQKGTTPVDVTLSAEKGKIRIVSAALDDADKEHQPSRFADQVKEKASRNNQVVVLSVMALGGAFVGGDEYRRRTRYAVLSALLAESYTPVDPEHIGYIETSSALGVGFPQFIPFEWFRDDTTKRNLVLLWLDENSLSQPIPSGSQRGAGPLARLAKIVRTLLEGVPQDKVQLDFIGPAGTDLLVGMADELNSLRMRPGKDELVEQVARMGFFSPFATVSDEDLAERLLTKPGDPGASECGIWDRASDKRCDVDALFQRQRGEQAGLRIFARATAPDSEVIGAVFKELRRRRIDASLPIAIVSEEDTEYARQLKRYVTFAHQSNIHSFGYMRGIDGRVVETEKAPEAKGATEKAREQHEVERPEGDSQIDYLRRLADLMRERERSLDGHSHAGPVRFNGRKYFGAIGIMGNDYYDKLLVLQALRPMFPEAIFFTTDLYAAMLHPADNRVTRNLIVGSGYGLTLHPALQGATPPFRDSYQTAAFLAVKLSLAMEGKPGPIPRGVSQSWLYPTVMEVGRTRFYDLDIRPEGCNPNPMWCKNPSDNFRRIADFPFSQVLWIVGAGFLLVLAISSTVRDYLLERWRRWWLYPAILVPLVVVACLAYLAVEDARHSTGEPLAWFDGVSVWPSNLMRIVAIILAVVALVCSLYWVNDRARHVSQKFFPAKTVFAVPADLQDHYANPRSVWAAYEAAVRWWRIAGFSLIKLAVVGVFLSSLAPLALRPAVPARSDLAFGMNSVLVLCAAFCTLYLLVCVATALRRTGDLARGLASRTWWPDDIRREHGLPDSAQVRQFDDWLDLQVIARQSESVNNLIYLPFAALLLLVVARSRIFDNWSMHLFIVLVLGFFFVYLIVSAIGLRYDAERARKNAVLALKAKLIYLEGIWAQGPRNGGRTLDQTSFPALTDSVHASGAQGSPPALENATQSPERSTQGFFPPTQVDVAKPIALTAVSAGRQEGLVASPLSADVAEVLASQCRTLIAQIETLNRGAFSPFTQQPIVRAILALAGGISGAALFEYASAANF